MSKILYIVDNNKKSNYKYEIEEDTTVYHFSINSSSEVIIDLVKEDIKLEYYYSNINYDDNKFVLRVNHLASNTHSEVYNHGVNVYNNKLDYDICGSVIKSSCKCICNQDNQIINLVDGKSTILPKLLIDNYDVDSNHAAYIGKFRDDILFYLMSRGISKNSAYELLLKGFLINNIDVDNDEVRFFIDEVKKI